MAHGLCHKKKDFKERCICAPFFILKCNPANSPAQKTSIPIQMYDRLWPKAVIETYKIGGPHNRNLVDAAV